MTAAVYVPLCLEWTAINEDQQTDSTDYMNNKVKIFNDPIYGLVSFPYPILYDLIEHPFVQRLRRISQTGLTYLVYPGAMHTRFHHALGALHLMTRAIDVLRSKGTQISAAEAEGACIAILLHDVGHGPFSHALERRIIPIHHEELSIAIFGYLNVAFDGKLDLAIQIFKGTYSRKFLHQLVSSQLDVDRLDYLNRDSFFTGVAEGVIGYDRIIAMLRVVDDELVVEEKGIYSVDKFLIARTIMYWQVYLHKTVLSAEKMLVHFWDRYCDQLEARTATTTADQQILSIKSLIASNEGITDDLVREFCDLDDYDIYSLLKKSRKESDFELQYLSKGLLDRKIHRMELTENQPTTAHIDDVIARTSATLHIDKKTAKNLIFTGEEITKTYTAGADDIKFILRDERVSTMQNISSFKVMNNATIKHYLCYPK